jgi:hypothetical protein
MGLFLRKPSDANRRKSLSIVGVGLFPGAPLLRGLATRLERLIVCGAVQAHGAGGELPIARMVAGDLGERRMGRAT